ncbi:MAG: type II toxin-antitoxin system death-on-curing family toxin [Syntrophobacteraceae bacterium]|jgi:death-on-curing protein
MTRRWLLEGVVIAVHGEQVAEHGGSPGIRDAGLLSSALARPQNQAVYGEPSVFNLAAAYAFGIIRNHPFVDGNKRTGFLAAYVFLDLNGWELTASEAEAVAVVLASASSEMDEAGFADWLKTKSVIRVMQE